MQASLTVVNCYINVSCIAKFQILNAYNKISFFQYLEIISVSVRLRRGRSKQIRNLQHDFQHAWNLACELCSPD